MWNSLLQGCVNLQNIVASLKSVVCGAIISSVMIVGWLLVVALFLFTRPMYKISSELTAA